MTSDFYFTATSWFPGNVRIKPHSKHSGKGGGVRKWQNSVHVVVECPLRTRIVFFFHYFFQIEVHEELADADKISANGSDILCGNSDQDAEDVALTGNGNGYQNGNCQEIRRSTIMFVIKSNQDLTKTASQQNGSKPSPIRGLIR